jgi:ElaB/YqjD/DUF883 family membrane-anchored ribosome-binding protein
LSQQECKHGFLGELRMADRNDAPSSLIGQHDAAGRTHSTAKATGERTGNVVAEFVDAARSAAESLLEEQKQQVAERVSGMAEALRGAVHPLHRSQNRMVARYMDQAASQVEDLSRSVRERGWPELVAVTEDFARRQPTWFVLGAVATGFLVGRLLWASGGAQQYRDGTTGVRPTSVTTRAVTAAVSSGSGTGEEAGHAAGSSGAVEAG